MESAIRNTLLDHGAHHAVGLIYSSSKCNQYFLEIVDENTTTAVKDSKLQLFSSLLEARGYAKQAGCTSLYICIEDSEEHNQKLDSGYSSLGLPKSVPAH